MCPILSKQFLLNRSTIFNQTWYCGVLSGGKSSDRKKKKKKNWFPIVNVKITVRAYIIKIWLFLLYLPNCWSICNQTRFDSTTYKPDCPCGKNWITALKVNVTSKVKNVSEYLSSEPQNILSPNLVWWCCRMSQSVTQKKNCLLSSRSRSQRGLILSKYYSDYYIFWTADSLATRHGLMIGHHRPERLVEKLDYCSQGHSEGSKCWCLSRWVS